MTADPAFSSKTHTYKYKPWVLIVNVFTLLVIVGLTSIPMSMFIAMLNTQDQTVILSVLLLCLFGPLAVMLALVLLMITASTITAFFAYVKVSPEGIEHKVWPARHIFARWSEVDRLGELFLYKSLFLKSYQVIGTSTAEGWPLKYLKFSQTSIPISAFNGWPDGPLAQDLKNYAPRLFEIPRVEGAALNQATAQAAAAAHAQPSEPSEEDRTLAAFAHGSVLFAGVIVPLIIYLVQKKKSAFLAFHLLQAFYYQLIGMLLVFVLPSCVFSVTFLPVISALSSGDSAVLDAAPILFIIWVVLALVLVFGNLALIIYGIVGAVQTFRGRVFRYVVIGRMVEKGSMTGQPGPVVR